MKFVKIINAGKKIKETDYWDSGSAQAGKLYFSINAGCIRSAGAFYFPAHVYSAPFTIGVVGKVPLIVWPAGKSSDSGREAWHW